MQEKEQFQEEKMSEVFSGKFKAEFCIEMQICLESSNSAKIKRVDEVYQKQEGKENQ